MGSRAFVMWLVGSRVSLVGDAVLYFALGWAGSAYGGGAAGLVLTAITVPRTVLLLVGGAVGDRFGARRVMVVGDAVMLLVTLGLALMVRQDPVSVWLLVGVAGAVGAVDAFYLPAGGSMPRRLVGEERLPRALAMQQTGRQLASLLGAPLGAMLVAAGGLGGALLFDAVTFAGVLGVLLRLDAGNEQPACPERLLMAAVDGVRLVRGDRVLRSALLLTAVASGALLPVVSLLSPLLAREHGWGAQAAGAAAGAQATGVIAVSLLVARRGPLGKPMLGTAIGLGTAAAGIAGMAVAGWPVEAVVAAVVVGLGSGMFAAQIGPVVLAGAPSTHLSRVQALLALAQSTALVVANIVLGQLADTAGTVVALTVCALITGLAAAGTYITERTSRRSRWGPALFSAMALPAPRAAVANRPARQRLWRACRGWCGWRG